MKILITALLGTALMLGTADSASAVDRMRVLLYGVVVEFPHPPMQIEGYEFVPLEDLAAGLGADFYYDADTETITIVHVDVGIVFQFDSARMLVLGILEGYTNMTTVYRFLGDDGYLLFTSPIMHSAVRPIPFEIDVTGFTKPIIEVNVTNSQANRLISNAAGFGGLQDAALISADGL